jgi:hypothetical protein
MDKLKLYLVGNDPQPIELELSTADKPKSTTLTLDGGKVSMKLTFKGKNEKTNAFDVDYEVEAEVVKVSRKPGALAELARKTWSGFLKYLPHSLVVTAGAAITGIGLMCDYLKTTLGSGFYPALGAVFVAIEALAIGSILARIKETKEE